MEKNLIDGTSEKRIDEIKEIVLEMEKSPKLTKTAALQYKQYVTFLKSNDSYSILPKDKLEQLKVIPITLEVLKFLGDYVRIFTSLRAASITTLDEFYNMDRYTFMSLRGVGRGSWAQFFALRYVIAEKYDELFDFYHICNQKTVYPILPKGKSYTLAEQVARACEQLKAHVQRYSEYKPKTKAWAEKIELVFQPNVGIDKIRKQLNVSSERVRQIKEHLVMQFRKGFFYDFPNIQISPKLLARLDSFENTGSAYKSLQTVNRHFGCKSFDDSYLPIVLNMKKTLDYSHSDAYVYFDQPYLVPFDESLEVIRKYVSCIYKVMGGTNGAEIRPVNLKQIMSELEDKFPDFKFDENRVDGLLKQHTWVDKIVENGEQKFQLTYSHLCDYQKIARIVYEKKSVSLAEIREADIEKSQNGVYLEAIDSKWAVTRQSYSWACNSGQFGVYIYDETGIGKESLIDTVKKYAKQKKCFHFDDLMAYLKKSGYHSSLKEASVRNYVIRVCQTAVDDINILCLSDCLDEYPEYRWRRRNQIGIFHWVLEYLVLQLRKSDQFRAKRKDLNQMVKAAAKKTDEHYRVNDISVYIKDYCGPDKIFDRDGDELFLTEIGQKISDKELSVLGNKNMQPDYYREIADSIYSSLLTADNQEMLLKDLKAQCVQLLDDKAYTLFYKIVDKCLPYKTIKVEKADGIYLKLLEE